MIKNPLASVIIPLFNREESIERCLRSVINQQTQFLYDIICVDDGSTDNSRLILQKYRDSIKIISNENNCGLPFSLNQAIKSSKSRFIVRVDSDDYISGYFVEMLCFTLLNNSKISAVACDYVLVEEDGTETIKNCQEDPIACGIMFSKDSLASIGFYNEKFKIHEDKELRQRYDAVYNVERLPIPLYRYFKHPKNLTKDKSTSSYFLKLLTQGRDATQ
jgi:glycosyltransferase involved in cell wall biosynthesis